MIDLHSHILPGIDDGARTIELSLDMARMAVAGGVSVMACTPHILQGVWANTGPDIRRRVADLQATVDAAGIPLEFVIGADIHIAFDLVTHLRSGRNPSLAGSRYVLLELPHHVVPSRLASCFFACINAGYVPILTHPERLGWIGEHYDEVRRLASAGVWMQLTAGSLTGAFGPRARYWAERMLDDGIVHILASDAHDTVRRPPDLCEGRRRAEALVGSHEALNLVETRPLGILANAAPNTLPSPGLGTTSDVDNEDIDDESTNSRRADRLDGFDRLGQRVRKHFGWRRAG